MLNQAGSRLHPAHQSTRPADLWRISFERNQSGSGANAPFQHTNHLVSWLSTAVITLDFSEAFVLRLLLPPLKLSKAAMPPRLLFASIPRFKLFRIHHQAIQQSSRKPLGNRTKFDHLLVVMNAQPCPAGISRIPSSSSNISNSSPGSRPHFAL